MGVRWQLDGLCKLGSPSCPRDRWCRDYALTSALFRFCRRNLADDEEHSSFSGHRRHRVCRGHRRDKRILWPRSRRRSALARQQQRRGRPRLCGVCRTCSCRRKFFGPSHIVLWLVCAVSRSSGLVPMGFVHPVAGHILTSLLVDFQPPLARNISIPSSPGQSS